MLPRLEQHLEESTVATNQKGAYLPTSQVWDVGNIENVDASASLKELLVRMYQNLGAMATMVNYKDTGIYPLDEFVCGQVYFKDPLLDSSTSKTPKLRQVYRKVINFGPLPVRVAPATSANISIAHNIAGIDVNTRFTRIYGCSSSKATTTYVPIPYAWPNDAKESIALFASATDVTIVTGDTGTWAGYDDTFVVIEYLKF